MQQYVLNNRLLVVHYLNSSVIQMSVNQMVTVFLEPLLTLLINVLAYSTSLPTKAGSEANIRTPRKVQVIASHFLIFIFIFAQEELKCWNIFVLLSAPTKLA